MLNKIGGLARALYIVLAIVAGFVALGMMDVPLVLVVLGLIAGLAMPEDRLVLATVTLDRLADHRRGAWPHPDDRRAARRGLRQSSDRRGRRARDRDRHRLYDLVMDGVTGLTGAPPAGAAAAAR